MSITINITGADMADVIRQIGAFYGANKPAGVVPRADQPAVSDKNTGSSGSGQEPAIHSAPPKVSSPPAPTESVPAGASVKGAAVEPQSEATASSTSLKKAIQALANAKSKTVGAEKVKATISQFGGAQVSTTPVENLEPLKAALEAL